MKRSTIIIVFIFIVLLAFTLIWEKNRTDNSATATVSSTPVSYLLTFDQNNLQEIQITDNQERSISIIKNETGTWAILGDPDQPADGDKVQTLIDQLAALSILSTLDTAPDANVIGLDQPPFTIKLSQQNGVVNTVYVGNLTPTNSGYYVKLDGKSEIHIITKYNMDSITKILDNPPLPSTPTPEAEVLTTPQP
jgi:hypothetical protein